MSNNRSRAVDPRRKSDQALNLADFKIDDILNIPGDQLLAEVAEDFGDPAFLAAEFDSIALPAVSRHSSSGLNRRRAVATFPVQPAALGAPSVRAFSRSPPAAPWSFSRAALAIPAEWLVVPLRRRIFLGTFATVLLVVALAPGIYPLLFNRSAAPVAPVDQSPAEAGRVQALQQAISAERMQFRVGTDGRDQAAGLAPDRQASPLPSASLAPRGRAPQIAAAAPAAVGAPAPANPRVTEGDGFFVELSAPRSAAEAQSILQALKSKYSMLEGHEPVIRRKDEGQRGVIYAVQLGPFESLDDADKLCRQLRTAGGNCFVTRN